MAANEEDSKRVERARAIGLFRYITGSAGVVAVTMVASERGRTGQPETRPPTNRRRGWRAWIADAAAPQGKDQQRMPARRPGATTVRKIRSASSGGICG
jgi:hypothetical protein